MANCGPLLRFMSARKLNWLFGRLRHNIPRHSQNRKVSFAFEGCRLGMLSALVCHGGAWAQQSGVEARESRTRSANVSQACSTTGCHDSAGITATIRAKTPLHGKHDFKLAIDGATVLCSIEVKDIKQLHVVACHGGVTVWMSIGPEMQPKQDKSGSDPAFAREYVPEGLRWEVIAVGRPTEIHVVHSKDGEILVDRRATFSTYRLHHPNGERCGPTCAAARVDWGVL